MDAETREWVKELDDKVDQLLQQSAVNEKKRNECLIFFDERYAKRPKLGNLYMWVLMGSVIFNIVLTLFNGG